MFTCTMELPVYTNLPNGKHKHCKYLSFFQNRLNCYSANTSDKIPSQSIMLQPQLEAINKIAVVDL